MKNIKLVIEYTGTKYCGWQIQKNGVGIQEIISNAIEKATNEKVVLNGSGRTDSGVHAIGQVASFMTSATIPAERISFAVNTFLPDDISIVTSEEVESDFHARYSARGKVYRYYIWNSIRKNSIIGDKVCLMTAELDVEKMKRGSRLFIGTHDFSAFKAQGSKVKTNVREIYKANVSEVQSPFGIQNGKLICIELTGSGFLYNMVRIISGTLLEIGLGKRTEEDVLEALEKGDRRLAGQTLPPEGLFLCEVIY